MLDRYISKGKDSNLCGLVGVLSVLFGRGGGHIAPCPRCSILQGEVRSFRRFVVFRLRVSNICSSRSRSIGVGSCELGPCSDANRHANHVHLVLYLSQPVCGANSSPKPLHENRRPTIHYCNVHCTSGDSGHGL